MNEFVLFLLSYTAQVKKLVFPLILSEAEGQVLGGKKAVPIVGYRISIINHQLKTKPNGNFYNPVIG